MLPGMELMGCTNLAVPAEVMHHIVRVESSYNPYAIGVVGGRLARQPRNLPEAVATARMLESRGYNFSLGLAQVNRYNMRKYGLDTYERAFGKCANLSAGASILAECHSRSKGDWGNAFSCYYSGNFVTGYRHGYVQKVFASMSGVTPASPMNAEPIGVIAQVNEGGAGGGAASGSRNARPSDLQSTPHPLIALRGGSMSVSRAESIQSAKPPVDMAAVAARPVGEPQPGRQVVAEAEASPALPGQAVATQAAMSDARTSPQKEELSDSAFVF